MAQKLLSCKTAIGKNCPLRQICLNRLRRYEKCPLRPSTAYDFGGPVDPHIHTHTHSASIGRLHEADTYTHSVNNCLTTPHSRTVYEHAKQHVLERRQQVFLKSFHRLDYKTNHTATWPHLPIRLTNVLKQIVCN